MPAEHRTDTGRDSDRPAGSQPKGKPDDRERDKSEEASAGEAPIDPADEAFIESSK